MSSDKHFQSGVHYQNTYMQITVREANGLLLYIIISILSIKKTVQISARKIKVMVIWSFMQMVITNTLFNANRFKVVVELVYLINVNISCRLLIVSSYTSTYHNIILIYALPFWCHVLDGFVILSHSPELVNADGQWQH